jgi:hypothetical protein
MGIKICVEVETGAQPLSLTGRELSSSVPDILLEFCSREDSRYKRIRDEHYVKNKGAQGQQVHFLVWYKRALVGIISGGAAAWAVKPRDSFFGITSANRRKRLNGIVDNTVFRLITTEKQLGLGAQVVAVWRKVVSFAWEYLYGVRVYGFETFVVETETRKGTLYKGDNWTLVGKTAGSAKSHSGMALRSTREKTDPKLIYCKWRDDFSTAVEFVYTSSWRGKTPEEKRRAKTLKERRAFLLGKVAYAQPDVAISPAYLLEAGDFRAWYRAKTNHEWGGVIAWIDKELRLVRKNKNEGWRRKILRLEKARLIEMRKRSMAE